MHMATSARSWAENVFGSSNLGDKRRTERLVEMASHYASSIGESTVRACGGDPALVEGAYRFIRNDKISPQAIAEGGFQSSAKAAQDYETLLAVEDTTTLSYQHNVAKELGDLGGVENARHRGLWVHSVLLLDADSEHTIGLIEQARWCRDPSLRGQKHARGSRDYKEKESMKWETASRHMEARLGTELMSRVISVCDRESDVYEYLTYKSEQRFVIRASSNRSLVSSDLKLFEQLRESQSLGTYQVEVPQKGGRKARTATGALTSTRVTLKGPARQGGLLSSFPVNVVLAQEVGKDNDPDALCWQLLTSEPVNTFADARKVMRYYELRWRVEEFHKAWKSGASVEKQRMQSSQNIERVAVILAFVAVRLLQLREAISDPPSHEKRSIAKDRSCTEVLTKEEWRVLWIATRNKKPPKQAPPMKWAYQAIAKLGGWLDSKGTGKASWDTIWRGWYRLQDKVEICIKAKELLA